MKVYVVYGAEDTEWQSDYEVYGVFADKEKAIDFAIVKARKAFDKCMIPAERRECAENDLGHVFFVFDNYDYVVDIMVDEKSMMC